MIAYLSGSITYKSPTYIYVECHGVGYHVNISLHTYSKIESLERVKIYTYMHVKEDDQSLYGFFDTEERSLFALLISVSGIGPNTARVMLSYLNPEEIKSAIVHENVVALNKIKGIGPKTAKRIILDLKDKVIKESGDQPILVSNYDNTIKDEALSALIALGFPKTSVEKQLNSVLSKQSEINQVEDLIKMVLKQMS